MPRKSRWSVDVPLVSLPTFVLGNYAADLPDTPAYLDAEAPHDLCISFSDFALWSKRLAAGLREAGLRRQERVFVLSGNNIFFPVVFMGVIMAGGIITTANPAFVSREVAYQLKDSNPRFFLVAETALGAAISAAKDIGFNCANMFVFDEAPLTPQGGQPRGAIRHWQLLISGTQAGEEFSWDERNTVEACQETVAILYSSGTTGVPKGVEISHYHLVANACQIDYVDNLDPRFARHQTSHHLLCALPMYHGLGLLMYATVAPYRRSPVYIMKRYTLPKLLKAIHRNRITELTLVPPIILAMVKSAELRQGKHDVSSVRRITTGAAPITRETCEELEKLWPRGDLNVKQAWGMTELAVTFIGWDPRHHSTSAAVGEPMPNCEVMIRNEDGSAEVEPGQRGELWCRGPNTFKCYWKRPDATSDTKTADGWVKTGDIAYVDEEGRYRIVDRKKELIKVKGNQVAPAELEGLLQEHPDIEDAAVIGIKVKDDERPLAYIVRRPGACLEAKDVLIFMETRTAKIKRLTGGIVFIKNIPRNPSGKILRRDLRAALEAECRASGAKL